jgi:hypothetical protein
MRTQRSKHSRGKPRPDRRQRDAAPPRTVALPPEFGIEAAAALHRLLSMHVAATELVVLETPTVKGMHTAALQVLAAFVRTRAETGRATAWRNPPDDLRLSAARLGLEDALGLAAILV